MEEVSAREVSGRLRLGAWQARVLQVMYPLLMIGIIYAIAITIEDVKNDVMLVMMLITVPHVASMYLIPMRRSVIDEMALPEKNIALIQSIVETQIGCPISVAAIHRIFDGHMIGALSWPQSASGVSREDRISILNAIASRLMCGPVPQPRDDMMPDEYRDFLRSKYEPFQAEMKLAIEQLETRLAR